MRVCSICHHRKLAQIDHALLAGQTQAAVARKYSVSPDAVNRHTRHMQTAIAQAVAAREPNRGNDIAYGNALLDELGRIKASVEHVEQEAENARDWRTLLMATKQRADLVKLQADLTGQVEGTRNLNVNVDMQVDEATAQRIVSAYLLTHGRPQDAPQGEATCNQSKSEPKIN